MPVNYGGLFTVLSPIFGIIAVLIVIEIIDKFKPKGEKNKQWIWAFPIILLLLGAIPIIAAGTYGSPYDSCFISCLLP